MYHGGDGAGYPPHQPFHWLDVSWESAPPSKRWSISRGINLEKVWQANEKKPLPIMFDNVEHTMQPIENNVKYFTRLVGNQVRFTVLPCYPSWTEVPEDQQVLVTSIIESYFDLQDDQSLDEYREACTAVDRVATDRYRDYKLKAHNHLKPHKSSRPYSKLSVKDW
ncbi:Uncharacterized protein Adt_33707 [Abeliophyllum distichum]|uniref:Transposase n=1 Tax=Abeliophyllum distichum TaxID=126358 RepID=A0ABD1QX10_9LAMI